MAKDLIKERDYWGLPVLKGKFMVFVVARHGTGTVVESLHTDPNVDGRERETRPSVGFQNLKVCPVIHFSQYNHTS